MEQRGGISRIYSSLAMDSRKTPYMLAWEADLQLTWDLDTWHKAMGSSFRGILNISLVEANLKVFTRWYLTPTRLSAMYPSTSPLCFRGCQLRGSMLHVWWECPKIRSFWNKIFHIASKITGLAIPRSPATALLNHLPSKASKSTRKLIFFIFLGAKITLARSWKRPKVSITAAKRKISWIMFQEKMMSSILDTFSQFREVWDPWATYMGIGDSIYTSG